MKKLISFLRWILLALIVPGILTLLAYVLFPIAYLLRKPLRYNYYLNERRFVKCLIIPLWIFLDDESYYAEGHDQGSDWWREAKNLKTATSWQRFKAAYLWGVVRNPVWNMYYLIRPKQEGFELISAKGSLTKNGEPMSLWNFAVLKYVDGHGNYKDNKGPYLSLRYSIIGRSFVWYKSGGRLYWRTSFAGKRFGRWIEFQAGTNNRRYTIRLKIKNVKVYGPRFSL